MQLKPIKQKSLDRQIICWSDLQAKLLSVLTCGRSGWVVRWRNARVLKKSQKHFWDLFEAFQVSFLWWGGRKISLVDFIKLRLWIPPWREAKANRKYSEVHRCCLKKPQTVAWLIHFKSISVRLEVDFCLQMYCCFFFF